MSTSKPNLNTLRHSTEHVLTQAMQNLYPGKFLMAMGPSTNNGFYFDFETLTDFKIGETDFAKIEDEMTKIIKADLLIVKKEISPNDAKKLFADNPYKLEWIKDIEAKKEPITVYYTGTSFVDICKGPHLASTGQVKAFKLLSIAGAYWHGDKRNRMLTRIYGTAFDSQQKLDRYLSDLAEAKKRDHRQIGQDLDLFSFHPEAPADIFWHDRGYTIFKQLLKYWRQIHVREGYQEVRTPEIMSKQIWDQSGHLKNFIEKLYKVTTPDAKKWDMVIKPMNCDGGILIYKSSPRSYKDFPLKMGELGVVHRYEASGETHGIIRTREFTQDDAHIYCTPDQVKAEIKKIIDLCFEVYQTFGLKLDHLELSTQPKYSIGSDEVWQKAESIMRQILKENKIPHLINKGDGAFYGPKFDFHLKDSLNRTWQCSTIQLDFAQPQNFDLKYTDSDGQEKQPVMIHRVLYGSVERFLGILIENCAGAFPTWLSPVQVQIIPITDAQNQYAQTVKNYLYRHSIRVQIDEHAETMQNKIRQAAGQKIPFMLIIGQREAENNTVSVRQRDGQDLKTMSIAAFTKKIKTLIRKKAINLIK